MVDEARRRVKPRTILVIEDDRDIARLLELHLRDAGYDVQVAQDGETGCTQALSNVYDLILLDLMLPGMEGLDICRTLRTKPNYTPILMLTAKSTELDRVLGLEVGADDYLTKPFEPKELLARIRAHLRRVQEYRQSINPPESIVVGDLVIDYALRDVLVKGQPANLTNREFELVSFLARHANKALHRDWVFEQIWGYDSDFSSNSLDVYVYRLRKKIEADPDNPRHLMTLRGYGYKFVTE